MPSDDAMTREQREKLEGLLLALAAFEARTRRAALGLARDDADVAALLADIAAHRDCVIAALEHFVVADGTRAGVLH
jgi:hypothetical protein